MRKRRQKSGVIFGFGADSRPANSRKKLC